MKRIVDSFRNRFRMIGTLLGTWLSALKRILPRFWETPIPEPEACACQRQLNRREERSLDRLRQLRDICPALQILIPDWTRYEEIAVRLETDPSGHRSMILLAFERDHLDRITGLLHKFLIEGGVPKPTLTPNYRRDLSEQWIEARNGLRRHQRSRMYMGKIMELLVAESEEQKGAMVIGLEALGASNDVIIARKDIVEAAIEVKYIGPEDWDFEDIQDALTRGGVGKGRSRSLPSVADYLLIRIYEAGCQLQGSRRQRVVAIIINEYLAWPVFKFVRRNARVDFRNPKLTSDEAEFLKFVNGIRKEYPMFDTDFEAIIQGIDEIRIYTLVYGYELEEQFVYRKD